MYFQRKIILIFILFVVTSTVAGLFVVYAFQGILKDHEGVIAQKRELVRFQEERREIKSFETLSSQYAKEFAQFESVLIDLDVPVEFFRFLDRVSNESQVSLQISPGALEKAQNAIWSSKSFRLSGSGSHAAVMAFLVRIENAPYILEVGSVNLTRQGAEAISFSIDTKVYTR